MNIEVARALVDLLTQGIAAANKAGSTDVQITEHLQHLDDQARAELQAAIDAAK